MNKIKFFLITITLLFFSNCGYKPIYSSTNKNNEKLLYVSVKSIKDRPGQILRNNLSLSNICPCCYYGNMVG